jgi:hypothetical protein
MPTTIPIPWADILTTVASFMGLCILLGLILLVGNLRAWLVRRVVEAVKQSGRLSREIVQMNLEVEVRLRRLLDKFQAARVGVWQFHNGEVFMLASHSWKITQTYEAVAAGVQKSKAHANLLVSQMSDFVAPVISGEVDGVAGCDLLECAPEACKRCVRFKTCPKIFVFDTRLMEPSMTRMLFEGDGVYRSYVVPLFSVTRKGTDRTIIGLIALQYGPLSSTNFEAIELEMPTLCEIAGSIQFILSTSKS